MFELPPYSCDNSLPPIPGGAAIFDQNGALVTIIESTECNAEYYCQVAIMLGLHPGAESLTWIPYTEHLKETVPDAEDPAPPIDEPEETPA